MAIVERSVPRVLPRPQIQDRIGQLFQSLKSEIKEEVEEIREDLDPNKKVFSLTVRSFDREALQNLLYKDKLFIYLAKEIALNPRNRKKEIIPCEIKHWKSK